MVSALGYRGYISSRSFCGERAPQHVQNLVIRSYCARNNLEFLLSATEVAMPGSYLMLEQLLNEIDSLDGIVCYSLLQIPVKKDYRQRVFSRILDAGRSIHFAVEGLRAGDTEAVERLEDIISVNSQLPVSLSVETFRNLATFGEIEYG